MEQFGKPGMDLPKIKELWPKVTKRIWPAIKLIALTIILSSLIFSGYILWSAKRADIRQEGYQEGYGEGYLGGHEIGSEQGYDIGYQSGHIQGKLDIVNGIIRQLQTIGQVSIGIDTNNGTGTINLIPAPIQR